MGMQAGWGSRPQKELPSGLSQGRAEEPGGGTAGQQVGRHLGRLCPSRNSLGEQAIQKVEPKEN